MKILDSTLTKIDSILGKISFLRRGDFPQTASENALSAIEELFTRLREDTKDLSQEGGTPKVVIQHCNVVLEQLFTYLPILGFLHRSKNSSNAFEIYGPQSRLAREAIDTDIQLIMSSEWDYSPYTFVQMPDIPSFVFVGLPASESGNALLVPLAGHEFGHSIWQRGDHKKRYRTQIKAAIVQLIRLHWGDYKDEFPNLSESEIALDLGAGKKIMPAVSFATRQCEEIFCDLTGLHLFGTAYLHAFAFLLAPGMSADRVPFYPTVSRRITYLIRAAAEYGFEVPDGYVDLFEPDRPTTPTAVQTWADSSTDEFIDSLIVEVSSHLKSRGVSTVVEDNIAGNLSAFALLHPAAKPGSLAAIVNAGWQAALDPDLWSVYPQIQKKRKIVLNELLLKAAQVLEVNERLSEVAGK